MKADVRASVDLVGSTLRYTEVEHYGDRRRLLRLGNCNFEYEAAKNLFGSDSSSDLEPIKEALEDVFAQLTADTVNLVLHPGNVLFFTSVTSDHKSDQASAEQLSAEAQHISTASRDEIKVFKQPFAYKGTSTSDSWHSVVAVRSNLFDRLDRVFSGLSSVDWTLRSNPYCAAHVASLLSARRTRGSVEEEVQDSFGVLVGWYPDFASLCVVKGEDLVFAQHMEPVDPVDCCYFGLQLLQHLGLKPDRCTRVSLYGEVPDVDEFEMMAVLSGSRPDLLNPIELVDIEEKTLVGEFDASAYVPVIGAAL